jgi:putative salt-induced outer membrane protein
MGSRPMAFAIRKSAARAAGTLSVLSLAAPAAAQAPTGLTHQAPATGGTTEVAVEGFQAAPEHAKEEENKDSSHLKLTAGGFLAQGNARTLAFTGSADYSVRRSASQFSVLAAVNFGRSAPAADAPIETTVENYQARFRYDYFFAPSIAGFFAASGRRDRFQGLDLRLNVGPGLAYYFIDDKAQGLWAELGYDFQYDLRQQDFIDLAALEAPPQIIADTEKRHNVRGFVGYDNQVSDAMKFSTGLEYLQNVEAAENARLNFDAALAVQLNQAFAVAVTVSLKYDNNPLPGVEETDLITALNLVYTMD